MYNDNLVQSVVQIYWKGHLEQPICTGFLYANSTIMTAAHCFYIPLNWELTVVENANFIFSHYKPYNNSGLNISLEIVL